MSGAEDAPAFAIEHEGPCRVELADDGAVILDVDDNEHEPCPTAGPEGMVY